MVIILFQVMSFPAASVVTAWRRSNLVARNDLHLTIDDTPDTLPSKLPFSCPRLQAGAHVIASEKKRHRTDSQVCQHWGYQNGYINVLANPDLVLDVKGESEEGDKIIVWKKKGENDNSNQLWVIENA
ncbi:hypothetical protein BC936DRAFT_139062 [Jimgerdemannia flammicorona]|uniref:Uncharacterized protein n=1 Tax=Jimgerdemannia flammicorona TaxID=994334 RepID=A0A433DI30_9FUNG|nr:hypothetical protein BC936DRAFT_139062 [Jimgerdemannia flammicorona]